MQTWLEVDEAGRQYLVRTGTGVVTAIAPVGMADPAGEHALYRVEIYCDAPHGRPGAIRYSAHATVAAGEPLLAIARAALDDVWAIAWTVQWHRHDWIPADLPIASLNLASDTRARLVCLDRVALPEPVDVEIPDLVPAAWLEEQS